MASKVPFNKRITKKKKKNNKTLKVGNIFQI